MILGLSLVAHAETAVSDAHLAAPKETPVVPVVATATLPAAGPSLQAALEQIAQENDLDKRLERLAAIAQSLAPSDFPAALDFAVTLKEFRERVWFQENSLNRWADISPEDAFQYLSRLPDNRLKGNAFRRAAEKMALLSPSQAGSLAEAMSPGVIRNEVITLIAHTWAQTDVAGALAWAEKLPDGFAKEEALTTVRYVWVNAKPEAAAPHVDKLPDTETNANLAGVVAYGWASRDLQAAFKWTEKLAPGAKKRAACINLAESWANRDPEGAAAFALKIPDRSAQIDAVALVAARWAKQYPEAAASWAWSIDGEDARNRALFEVLNLWGEYDPDACASWVEKQPAGPVRARGMEIVAAAISNWRPARAVEAALMIGDESVSDEIINQSLARWMEQDADSARAWLKSSRVPEALKKRLAMGAPGK